MADRQYSPSEFQPAPLTTPDGEAWRELGTGAHADIEAGVYTGPETRVQPMWKCPSCKVENTGRLEDGCTNCGSGTARPYKVEVRRPAPPASPVPGPVTPEWMLKETMGQPREAGPGFQTETDTKQALAVYEAALTWAAYNHHATLTDAYMAGYRAASYLGGGQPTPVTSPVTSPSRIREETVVESAPSPTPPPAPPPQAAQVWDPKTKGARTIVAALEQFKATMLLEAAEEIRSGEWCSPDEVDELIKAFQERMT